MNWEIIITGGLAVIALFVNLGRLINIAKEFLDVLVVGIAALEDMRVTKDEMDAIKKELDEFKATVKPKKK